MRYRWAVLTVLAFWCLESLVAISLAQEKETYSLGPLTGMVVDPAGKPVGGIPVRLLGRRMLEEPVVLGEVATDAQGRFRFEERKCVLSKETVYPLGLIVQDAQGRVGGTLGLGLSSGSPRPQEIPIQLMDVGDYRGRLVDASGKGIPGAQIKLISWSETRSGRTTSGGFTLSSEMAQRSATRTVEDGSFVIRGVPKTGFAAATITAKGFGTPYVAFVLNKPLTIPLNRAGKVTGSIVAQGKGDWSGTKLFLHSREVPLNEESEYNLYYYRLVAYDAQGKFCFEGVPSGKYTISPQLDENSPYVTADLTSVEVKPDQDTVVSIELKRALVVRGKVVDARTGQGIKGVQLSFCDVNADGRSTWWKTATTDDQGTYTVYVKPSKVRAQVSRVPAGYINVPLPAGEPDTLAVTGDMAWPDIQLDRGSTLEGIVVDKAGHPQPGAMIYYHSPNMESNAASPTDLRSDVDGKFTLTRIPPKGTITIRARTKSAAADPLTVNLDKTEEPLRLVADEKTSFALRGIVVNGSGGPIEKAEIQFLAHLRLGGWRVVLRCETGQTDAQGRFEVRGLWPGEEYQLRIELLDFEKYESPQVAGVAGGVHDFGKITLIETGGIVEGTVVDSATKPIANVRVFNWGDAPEPIETKSDAAGRFLLKGFRAGPAFVFAEKDGYRFTRLRTTSSTTAVTLTMLRRDEPAPRLNPSPTSLEPHPQLARKLLEKLWALGGRGRIYSTVASMARIDADQAQRWSRQLGGKFDSAIRRTVAERVAETDLEEALEMLGQEDSSSYYVFERLADRFASSDRQKARRVVEEATIRARGMDQPGRMSALAQLGSLLRRLGDEKTGRKLVEEAAESAANLSPSTANTRVVGEVASAMAAYDIDRALAMVDKIGDTRERNRWRASVAAAGGPGNVDRALAILKDGDSRNADRARIRLVYDLAATRPEDAMRIFEGMPASKAFGFPRESKAQMLRWMAQAIAPHDKTRAWKLIDDAFLLYLSPSEGEYSDNRRATQAAALGVVAKEIGYPDMESVVSRVIATRVTMKHAASPAAVVESATVMAMILACIDPETACQILAPLELRGDSVGSGFSGVGADVWLKAWALANPEHGMELADRELAKAKTQSDWDPGRAGLLEIAQLWTLPPGERFRRVARHLHNLSFPEDEY